MAKELRTVMINGVRTEIEVNLPTAGHTTNGAPNIIKDADPVVQKVMNLSRKEMVDGLKKYEVDMDFTLANDEDLHTALVIAINEAPIDEGKSAEDIDNEDELEAQRLAADIALKEEEAAAPTVERKLEDMSKKEIRAILKSEGTELSETKFTQSNKAKLIAMLKPAVDDL